MQIFTNVMLFAALSSLLACGGSGPPPEQPEAVPEAPAAEVPAAEPNAPAPADGQHTMPDGSTMPNDQHK